MMIMASISVMMSEYEYDATYNIDGYTNGHH